MPRLATHVKLFIEPLLANRRTGGDEARKLGGPPPHRGLVTGTSSATVSVRHFDHVDRRGPVVVLKLKAA